MFWCDGLMVVSGRRFSECCGLFVQVSEKSRRGCFFLVFLGFFFLLFLQPCCVTAPSRWWFPDIVSVHGLSGRSCVGAQFHRDTLARCVSVQKFVRSWVSTTLAWCNFAQSNVNIYLNNTFPSYMFLVLHWISCQFKKVKRKCNQTGSSRLIRIGIAAEMLNDWTWWNNEV